MGVGGSGGATVGTAGVGGAPMLKKVGVGRNGTADRGADAAGVGGTAMDRARIGVSGRTVL